MILYAFLFSALTIIVQATNGKGDNENGLILEKCTAFNENIIKPLVEKCEGREYRESAEKNVKMLCKTVKALEKLSNELVDVKNNAGEENGGDQQIGQIFTQIYMAILYDTIALDIEYSKLIPAKNAKEIWLAVANVRIADADEKEGKEYEMQLRENFNEHYKKIVNKLKNQIEKGAGGSMEARKIAYDILQTSKFVGFEFDWSSMERVEFALQQFAVNTIIYGLVLRDVHRIGQNWTIGMDHWVTRNAKRKLELIKKSNQFYDQLIVPLLAKCKTLKKRPVAAAEKEMKMACESAKQLEEPLAKLAKLGADERGVKKNGAKIDKLFAKVHEIVLFDDTIGLDLHYAELLDEDVARDIWIAVANIRSKNIEPADAKYKYVYEVRANMNSHYKEIVPKLLQGGGQQADQQLVLAYEIVQLAKYMGFEFDWSDLELFDWALQQFAVNLMIYGGRVGEITAAVGIAANEWKVGMDEWL